MLCQTEDESRKRKNDDASVADDETVAADKKFKEDIEWDSVNAAAEISNS